MRSPGVASFIACPCRSSDRARPSWAPGRTCTRSPTASRPDHSVPVMTVPAPGSEKTRSTGRRRRSASVPRGRRADSVAGIRARSWSSPAPVRTDTATGGVKLTDEAESQASTSPRTMASHSGSTRSALVMTGMPAPSRSCSTMARCSRVWGMIPSSAATTRSTRSSPAAPATMDRIRSSWPGTSTTPATPPPGSGRGAKCRSRVMPRRRSSSSGSMAWPVRACTRADLP